MLTPGTKVGPYEVVSSLGAGGMGEVYRARDTRLDRDVAVKVLPEAFAADPERVARFEREAKSLAALNHPHIAQIHGFEETNGVPALVMELVEGETLADRIVRGPTALDEALLIAKQIAEALEAAHEHGIIHRDLKPANIKVRSDGTVKVLDFGLAKTSSVNALIDPTQSPTFTVAATQMGMIVGTAAYMAPEQARGTTVDKRVDIWAFGVVLFEMLTRRQPFAGDNVTDIIAAVVKNDPDWNGLPTQTPARVGELLRRCLEKDPKQRLRDIGDARIELEQALALPRGPAPVRASRWVRTATALGLLTIGLAAGSAVTSLFQPRVVPSSRSATRLAMTMPEGTRPFFSQGPPAIAISPDGRRVAFAALSGGIKRIYLRELGSLDAQPLAGTEGGYYPFFSPDGQWLGFLAERRLKKIAVTGGAPVTLMNFNGYTFGAAWSDQGTIAFVPRFEGPLWQVPAGGGPARELTKLDSRLGDRGHHWPQWLPGGKAIVFTALGDDQSWDDATIVAQALDSGERRVLVKGGTFPRYSPSGHLLYLRAGTIMAVPFDVDRLEVRGTPIAVVDDVLESVIGAGHVDFAATGVLVYVRAGANRPPAPALSWVDRRGIGQPLEIEQRPYTSPRVSPDGRRIAVWSPGGFRCAIEVFDLERESRTRLTFAGDNHVPVWTPDGQWVAYHSGTGGPYEIFVKRSDGSGNARQLTDSRQMAVPNAWTPDNRTLLFTQFHPDTAWDIWTLSLPDGPGAPSSDKPHVFLQSAANELMPALSADGRWLAYVSDETGRSEILVRSFPDGGGPWQVSADGGSEPVWSRDGSELFYRRGDGIMAARVSTKSTFSAGKAVMLFAEVNDLSAESWAPNYDVSSAGRLLMPGYGSATASAAHVAVVLDWFDELKAKVKPR